MGRARWHVDSNGQLSARVHGLKLIVCKFDACARYLIVQSATQGRPSTGIMLASGTEPSVDAAMMAAERVARSPQGSVDLDASDRPRLFKPFTLDTLLSTVESALHASVSDWSLRGEASRGVTRVR